MNLYTVIVPLEYNTYISNNPELNNDDRFIVEIEKPIKSTYRLNEFNEVSYEIKYVSDRIASISEWNTSFYQLTINEVRAEDKDQAIQRVGGLIDRISKAMSFMLNSRNYNFQFSQPRVYPNYHKVIVQSKTPEKEIYNYANMTLMTRYNAESFFKYFNALENNDIAYLISEYNLALGNEKSKSKFFHLFTIIEYIEEHFKKYNEAKSVFNDQEINEMLESMIKVIEDKDKNIVQRTKESIKSTLHRIDNLNRKQKLFNILTVLLSDGKSENITKIREEGRILFKDYPEEAGITLDDVGMIIKIRNSLYHASKNKNFDNEIKKYNIKLFTVDQKIIESLLEHSMALDNQMF